MKPVYRGEILRDRFVMRRIIIRDSSFLGGSGWRDCWMDGRTRRRNAARYGCKASHFMPNMRMRVRGHSDPHVSSGLFKKLRKGNGVPSFDILPLGAFHSGPMERLLVDCPSGDVIRLNGFAMRRIITPRTPSIMTHVSSRAFRKLAKAMRFQAFVSVGSLAFR